MAQQQILCRGCGTEIKFRADHKTEGGKWIPLNPDFTNHECPARKQQTQQQQQKPKGQISIPAATTTTF